MQKIRKTIIAVFILLGYAFHSNAVEFTIPVSNTVNFNTNTLNLPGTITNSGTLQVSTSKINVSGNWANSGTFEAGNSMATFTGASGSLIKLRNTSDGTPWITNPQNTRHINYVDFTSKSHYFRNIFSDDEWFYP